jgi:hypothetical protein
MSPTFFLVGGIIFAAYMYFTIWNIFYSSRKSREENYPTVNRVSDEVDMDGMGNFSRFPSTEPAPRKRNKKSKKRSINEIRQVKDSVYKAPVK